MKFIVYLLLLLGTTTCNSQPIPREHFFMVSNPGLQCEIELIEDPMHSMVLRTRMTNIGKYDIRFKYPIDFSDSLLQLNMIEIFTKDSVYRFKNEIHKLEFYGYKTEDLNDTMECNSGNKEKQFYELKPSQALSFTMSLAKYHDILNLSKGKYTISYYTRFPVLDTNYLQVKGFPTSYNKKQRNNSLKMPLYYAVFSNTIYIGEWKRSLQNNF